MELNCSEYKNANTITVVGRPCLKTHDSVKPVLIALHAPNNLIHQIPCLLIELHTFVLHGTRIMTFQAKAPASRIAQAKQLLFLLLMMAFHPRCAQIARTIISMSEPNCLF